MLTRVMTAWGIADALHTKGWSESAIDTVDRHLHFLKVEDSVNEQGEITEYAKFEYVDRLRYARAGNKEEVDYYMDCYRKGCCGFYDELIFTPEGEALLVGFNYGH